MSRNTVIKYKWMFEAGLGSTVRERIGNFIRSMASRIDGRVSVAITIESDPELPMLDKVMCVEHGLKHASRLFEKAVRLKCVDNKMPEVTPNLFEDQTNG